VALLTVSAMLARMREVWASILHTEAAVEAIAPPPIADTTEKDLPREVVAERAPEQAPPSASMPIGNRYVHNEPQNYPRFTPVDDWMQGSPRVLLDSMT
jgi:hypothetical protein